MLVGTVRANSVQCSSVQRSIYIAQIWSVARTESKARSVARGEDGVESSHYEFNNTASDCLA